MKLNNIIYYINPTHLTESLLPSLITVLQTPMHSTAINSIQCIFFIHSVTLSSIVL